MTGPCQRAQRSSVAVARGRLKEITWKYPEEKSLHCPESFRRAAADDSVCDVKKRCE